MGQFPYAQIPMKMQEDEETSSFMEDIRKLAAALQIFGNGIIVRAGSGSPEGVIVANRGSLYLRTDGGIGTTFYVKESGFGTNTGWTSK